MLEITNSNDNGYLAIWHNVGRVKEDDSGNWQFRIFVGKFPKLLLPNFLDRLLRELSGCFVVAEVGANRNRFRQCPDKHGSMQWGTLLKINDTITRRYFKGSPYDEKPCKPHIIKLSNLSQWIMSLVVTVISESPSIGCYLRKKRRSLHYCLHNNRLMATPAYWVLRWY